MGIMGLIGDLLTEIVSGVLRSSVSRQDYGEHVSQGVRRTDEEAKNQPLNWSREKAEQMDVHTGTLMSAAHSNNRPGVYIIYLYGQVMKVGSAEIGVCQRMNQYYNLNPYCGLKEITTENRDLIQVVWQDCPKCKCNELESKLFAKYGKGPWAKRAPHSSDDTWDLLI